MIEKCIEEVLLNSKQRIKGIVLWNLWEKN